MKHDGVMLHSSVLGYSKKRAAQIVRICGAMIVADLVLRLSHDIGDLSLGFVRLK